MFVDNGETLFCNHRVVWICKFCVFCAWLPEQVREVKMYSKCGAVVSVASLSLTWHPALIPHPYQHEK